MTGQRAGRLVAKHQMDTTNCLNAFSLICNWPHLWLNSLALPAVLSSAVGSPLAYTVQAPISMTVPARAVHLPVMPSHSKKICLISSVKHPQHISCLYFSFIFFGFFGLLLLMSAVAICHKEAFCEVGTGLLVFATLRYVNTGK